MCEPDQMMTVGIKKKKNRDKSPDLWIPIRRPIAKGMETLLRDTHFYLYFLQEIAVPYVHAYVPAGNNSSLKFKLMCHFLFLKETNMVKSHLKTLKGTVHPRKLKYCHYLLTKDDILKNKLFLTIQ